MLAQAMNAIHVPEVMGWKSESQWEEEGYAILSVDICVAIVHAFAEREIVPLSTSRLYWKLCRESPEVMHPVTTWPAGTGKEMIGFAFKKIFQLMPGVLGVALPQGLQQGRTWKSWWRRRGLMGGGIIACPSLPWASGNSRCFLWGW